MKTLEEALRDYLGGPDDHVYRQNISQLLEDIRSSGTYRRLASSAIETLEEHSSMRFTEGQRVMVEACIAAVFESGVIVGSNMEKHELEEIL